MSTLVKLRLLGRVKHSSIPSSFFTDYAEQDLHVWKQYKIISINGRQTAGDLGSELSIRRIRDQLGNVLKVIPEGWKAICSIQFVLVPKEVYMLKAIESWDYNPGAVDLELVEADASKHISEKPLGPAA